MPNTREKLEVIAHLGDHITYKEDIGICYDSALAKVIEDAYVELKNGVTVQSEIDAKTYQLMRECERLKEEKESLTNAVNVLEEINSDLCKQIKGVTVQDNAEITDELLKQLRNAPLTILHEEPTIEVVQGWISVKDRLPERNEDGTVNAVLVTNGSIQHIAYLAKDVFYFTENGEMKEPMFYEVTHWQYLPQPPKGE